VRASRIQLEVEGQSRDSEDGFLQNEVDWGWGLECLFFIFKIPNKY